MRWYRGKSPLSSQGCCASGQVYGDDITGAGHDALSIEQFSNAKLQQSLTFAPLSMYVWIARVESRFLYIFLADLLLRLRNNALKSWLNRTSTFAPVSLIERLGKISPNGCDNEQLPNRLRATYFDSYIVIQYAASAS